MVKEAESSLILLMAVSCNLDNVGIGIAYGARGISIPFGSNLLIAAITTLGTFLSTVFGRSMYLFLKPETANYIGSAILIGAGVWVAFYDSVAPAPQVLHTSENAAVMTETPRSFFRRVLSILNDPCSADTDRSSHIDLKEGTVLGLALTLNNMANGVGAGLIGLNMVWLALSVFLFSIATIVAGLMIGSRYGNRVFGRYSGLAAGLLLICIGIFELL
ncbi:MAG: sporulation membrane protein YtaF [Syntrophobacteraceae bacterium]